jgi:hypothetical protein
MWALETKEMESSFKIGLKDVLWWMSIKDAFKPKVFVITKLKKKVKIVQTFWNTCWQI